jgi:O-methyltransferase involved in polyketide biosynthesis
VTLYLKSTDVVSTLKAIAPLAANGGGVVFDYLVSPESLEPRQRAGLEALAARVAAAGEPFRSHFEPIALVAEMFAMAFRTVRDLGSDELNATYCSNRTDGLQVGSAGRILIAFG